VSISIHWTIHRTAWSNWVCKLFHLTNISYTTTLEKNQASSSKRT
jgi:hypothetical protein